MKVLIVLIVADAYQDCFPIFTSAYDDIKALKTFDRHAICAFYLHGNSSPSDGKKAFGQNWQILSFTAAFFPPGCLSQVFS